MIPFDNVSFDGGVRRWCLPEYDETEYLLQRFQRLQPGWVIRFLDMFACRYLLLRCSVAEQERVLTIGPYLSEPNSRESTARVQKKFGWDTRMGESLLEYRSSVPVVWMSRLLS